MVVDLNGAQNGAQNALENNKFTLLFSDSKQQLLRQKLVLASLEPKLSPLEKILKCIWYRKSRGIGIYNQKSGFPYKNFDVDPIGPTTISGPKSGSVRPIQYTKS